jgi:hypothetical protein
MRLQRAGQRLRRRADVHDDRALQLTPAKSLMLRSGTWRP